MYSRLRELIRKALERREDAAMLTSQGVQSVPAPLVLGDLVVRECVLAVQRGLDGWAPAEDLAERLHIYVGTVRGASLSVDEEGLSNVIERIWVSGDAPGIEGWDDIGLPIACERVLTLGAIGAEVSLEFARHLGDISDLNVTLAVLEDREISLAVVGRMAAIDAPVMDGCSVWGLSGSPIRLRVLGGRVPELHILLDVPLNRMPEGHFGARGVLVEDIRGPESIRTFATTMPYCLGANLALARLDDDASRQGGLAVGFAGRVSAVYEKATLGPVELLDEVTQVLPHLTRQLRDRQEIGDTFSALVLLNGISALVGRTKADPARGCELARQLLDRGLAPHVRDAGVYWLPIGEYPEVLPEESFDRVIAEGIELQ